MFDNDNAEACDKSGVAIRGRFPYDEQRRIILEVGHKLPTQICTLFVSVLLSGNIVMYVSFDPSSFYSHSLPNFHHS